MVRPLALALLAVGVAALAAPVPKKTPKDYQKLADETGWQFANLGDFDERLTAELKGYEVTTEADWRTGVQAHISDGKRELLVWPTHRAASFAQRSGVLYYTEFDTIASGCAVVAFDLNAKKRLWKTDLKGIGPVMHSKYRNEVRMEVLDDDTLRVFGKESAGRYVEIVDRATGKTVGNKVFKEKDEK